ncbi:MAG: 16S rRNA (guanine(966)-N(2))-methyltransferase RsmD [Anaerolineales bacterium]|nr:16S rRNA (guanine(966)-N(2))-methyltransferase RsmD [Anaerolineales bacterium]
MSGIRVIAGKAKGRKLKQVPGDSTRAVTDRVKESLFNILRFDIENTHLLDMFAGTGSIGIEALSQGSEFVRFLEMNKKAYDIILQNLETTGLTDQAEVIRGDAFSLMSRVPDRQFDYIYVAPPQYKEMWEKSLETIDGNSGWLVEDGWIIVQIHPREYHAIELNDFEEFDKRKYGNTLLVFFEKKPVLENKS